LAGSEAFTLSLGGTSNFSRPDKAKREINSQNTDKVRGARASRSLGPAALWNRIAPTRLMEKPLTEAKMTKVKSKPDDADRPTEDDVARERLGGSRGAAELKPAPMTRLRRIKTPSNDAEPGHTA